MVISKCIDKICNIPLDFKRVGKSAFTLAKESGFESKYENIDIDEIKKYLKNHDCLIDTWQQWSLDKRTTGYFLTLDNSPRIGALDIDGQRIFTKNFDTALDACAEFVYREVASILGLENKKHDAPTIHK
jgi:hypothetical protein